MQITELCLLKDIFDEFHKYVYEAVLYGRNANYGRDIESLVEIELLFNSLEIEKLKDPAVDIEDKALAILFSYIINPNLDITKRKEYYESILKDRKEFDNFHFLIMTTSRLVRSNRFIVLNDEYEELLKSNAEAKNEQLEEFDFLSESTNKIYFDIAKVIKAEEKAATYKKTMAEIKLFLTSLEKEKLMNPDADIDNKALLILYSYFFDASLSITYRIDHCDGIAKAIQGLIDEKSEEEILSECLNDYKKGFNDYDVREYAFNTFFDISNDVDESNIVDQYQAGNSRINSYILKMIKKNSNKLELK